MNCRQSKRAFIFRLLKKTLVCVDVHLNFLYGFNPNFYRTFSILMKSFRYFSTSQTWPCLQRSERDWRKLSSVLDEYEYAAVLANQMSIEQKAAKLDQLYEEEIAGYRTVIKRLISFALG